MSITMSTFAHSFSFDMDGANYINKPNHCHCTFWIAQKECGCHLEKRFKIKKER